MMTLTMLLPPVCLVTHLSEFQRAYPLQVHQRHRLYLIGGLVMAFWVIVAVFAAVIAYESAKNPNFYGRKG
jgi:hypothetical protein